MHVTVQLKERCLQAYLKHSTHTPVFVIFDKMLNYMEQCKRHLTCMKYGNEDFQFYLLSLLWISRAMFGFMIH